MKLFLYVVLTIHLVSHSTLPKEELLEFVEAEHASVNAVVEMQKRMHTERVQRIEESVVNVRKAELLLHRNRIAQHCRGLDKELEVENDRFVSVQDEVRAKAEAFAKDVAALQARLDSISDLDLLVSVKDKAVGAADAFRGEVRRRLQQYRQSVEDALNGFREANASLRTSFKTFSEGGNFSSFEVTTYR